ncbi:MAG: hypothetical protein GXP45_05525 [bacterium]|nr:hypothetical protein [bacterium]
MGDYQGNVAIKGTVEKLQGALYIVEVDHIVGDKVDNIASGVDQKPEYNSGKYFPQA